jgi:nitroreductase
MIDLDTAIKERRSTRMFLASKPVPRELVEEALALAQHAPSNSNTQPWHVVFASGARRGRLVGALLDEARRRPPNIPPLPETLPALSPRARRSSLRGDGNFPRGQERL